MYEILNKQSLGETIKLFVVKAPRVAEKAQAGQFIILRIDEKGERIPLTIADFDRKEGTITIVFQEVGKTTLQLGKLKKGDFVKDFVGPLGLASHMSKVGTVVAIGGGVGVAPVFPIARAFKEAGNDLIGIIGARTEKLVFWEDRMSQISDKLIITTDDGSYKRKGFVTDALKDIIDNQKVDLVIAIGPVPMMKAVSALTKEYGIKTVVSLNSIMVDGTGMCGACRVTVGGKTRFACVDGPEFDGHLVDYDEMMRRSKFFSEEEKQALKSSCVCGGKCRD